MQKEKFTMKIAVNLFLFRNGKVLLLRRCNTGWKDGMYSVPAGHVDGQETIAHAMAREAKEEADIDIREEDLRVAHVQHRMNPLYEYIDFSMSANVWTGEPVNLEPEKCDDLRWFPLDQLPENTVPYIRLVLENIQKGIVFSEWREEGT